MNPLIRLFAVAITCLAIFVGKMAQAQSLQELTKSAEAGDSKAQNSLGVMYAMGRGVPVDKEEALRWYKKAAKKGFAEAIYNVATSYYNGEGVNEDMPAAYAWMSVAAQMGDEQAAAALPNIAEELHDRPYAGKFMLAELYETGNELPQNMDAAINLYLELAGSNKHDLYSSSALDKLCLLYASDKDVPLDYAKARSWCKKSERPSSYLMLAQMSEKGLGQEKDLDAAAQYYKFAALAGDAEGFMNAGRLNMEINSKKALQNAYFWYFLATEKKIPGATEKLQQAAINLNSREIAEQQKDAARWFKSFGRDLHKLADEH